jgi:hypothetical protein
MVDPNFTNVRIYLDLADIGSEEGFLVKNKLVSKESNDPSSTRNSIATSLRMSVSNLANRLLRQRFQESQEKPKPDFLTIDDSDKNFTDVMLSRNNEMEIVKLKDIRTTEDLSSVGVPLDQLRGSQAKLARMALLENEHIFDQLKRIDEYLGD